ncbi:serine hydrolase [bacterium]|nr:serine hydrolase [bacterium]
MLELPTMIKGLISLLKNKNYRLILTFSILLNILLLVLLLSKGSPGNTLFQEDISKYPLIDPARTVVEQKHFLSTIEPLRRNLKEIVDKYESKGNKVGLYFEFLNTGSNISINQDDRFWPASLSKMPTALAVMKKVEKGDWKLSNELVILYEDRNDGFGDLYKKAAGTKISIDDLLKELIINSDDTAHRVLIRNLEGSDFEEMLLALGLDQLYDANYDITAKEYSRIFRALYSSSYLNRDSSSYLLRVLSETKFNDFLASGIPLDTVFSHKIGEHDPKMTYLDSGIVYIPNRPYLLTVMVDSSKSGGREEVKKIMKDISMAAYQYVSE